MINGGVLIRSGGVSQKAEINKRPPPVYSAPKSNVDQIIKLTLKWCTYDGLPQTSKRNSVVIVTKSESHTFKGQCCNDNETGGEPASVYLFLIFL